MVRIFCINKVHNTVCITNILSYFQFLVNLFIKNGVIKEVMFHEICFNTCLLFVTRFTGSIYFVTFAVLVLFSNVLVCY